ncbi:MAG: hypothetical protein FJW30_23150, partial [Acidobacteria bacterium]|nr:hypothetical protein [Acidobacteriota bacterium]
MVELEVSTLFTERPAPGTRDQYNRRFEWPIHVPKRLLLLALAGVAALAQFRAAAVKVDITPEKPQWLLGYQARKSTGVSDRLFHRIVVMDDGARQFLLVSSDLCLVSPAEYDRVAVLVTKATGLPPENFWWTFTHTHSAPEVGPPGLAASFLGDRYTHEVDRAYTNEVARKLVEGIQQARGTLQPARLAIGWGYAAANINRRARDVEGETFLGFNPDGPVDRRIGLLRLDSLENKPIVLIANYAMHGTVLGSPNLLISGDAQGIVSEYVESKIGAPMLYVNGAAGNLAPIYTTQPDARAGRLKQFRALLGERILEANARMAPGGSQVQLALGSQTIHMRRKDGVKDSAELADYL